MPTSKFIYKVFHREQSGERVWFNSVSKDEYELFNPSLLGLGDVSEEGEYVQALAAFLDLHGFHCFCNQVDAHLVIPEILGRYIEWLFGELRSEFKESEDDEKVVIWGSLPLFSKFLGDGILFLWDTQFSKDQQALLNIVLNLDIICNRYRNKFLPEINRHVSKPPSALRCGIARGQIIAIAKGADYVGSCINIASRLQKLSQLRFAVSKRGFDLKDAPKTGLYKDLILKKVRLAGVGYEELVYIKESEFNALMSRERNFFKEPKRHLVN